MNRILTVVALVAVVMVSPGVSGAQSGGIFEITRSTLDAGGSTERSPDNVVLRGTIGQPDAGAMGFGIYYLTGGLWATQGRLGIFFLDGFESGDTTAWSSTVGKSSVILQETPAALQSPSEDAREVAESAVMADRDPQRAAAGFPQ